MHGYELITWLERRSDRVLELEDSALYQALHRMEERRLVIAEWGVSENNRRARYYRIAAEGRRQLQAETGRWLKYAALVTRILTEPDAA